MDTTTKVSAVTAVIAIATAISVRKAKRKRAAKRLWTREWVKKREEYGACHTLMNELALSDLAGFKNYTRMSSNDFEFLLEKISPLISRQDTTMRKAISARERLAVTLHYLATGKYQ